MNVCLNGVGTFVLQRVGTDLVDDTNAAAFLLLVNNHSATLFRNRLHRKVKLFAAITFCRMKNIAGQTLRVYPDRNRLIGSQVTFVNNNEFFVARQRTIACDAKCTVFSRQISVRGFFDRRDITYKLRSVYAVSRFRDHNIFEFNTKAKYINYKLTKDYFVIPGYLDSEIRCHVKKN